jgi:hypothetical protein
MVNGVHSFPPRFITRNNSQGMLVKWFAFLAVAMSTAEANDSFFKNLAAFDIHPRPCFGWSRDQDPTPV